MAEDAPGATTDSTWHRGLEYSLFAVPLLFAVAIVSLTVGVAVGGGGGAGNDAGMLAAGAGILLAYGVVLVLAVLTPVFLFLDARAVCEADVEWDPSPVLYALGGLFLSGLVAMHYLWRRHQFFAMPVGRNGWWYGVAAALVLFVAAVVAVVSPVAADAVFAPAALSYALLPVAIYRDAGHVRHHGEGWLPNPVNYFAATLFGIVLLVVPPIVSAYYLYKRHGAVGTP